MHTFYLSNRQQKAVRAGQRVRIAIPAAIEDIGGGPAYLRARAQDELDVPPQWIEHVELAEIEVSRALVPHQVDPDEGLRSLIGSIVLSDAGERDRCVFLVTVLLVTISSRRGRAGDLAPGRRKALPIQWPQVTWE